MNQHPTPAVGAAGTDLDKLRALIADDSYAMTFQSFGQYRTALLKAIDHARRAAPSPQIRQADAERDLCLALLACPHSMDENRVVLYRVSNKEGGAYAQLANRLREAFVSLTTAAGGDAV